MLLILCNLNIFIFHCIIDMQSTWEEYKEWCEDGVDSYVEQIYKKALDKLITLLPFEKKLVSN